MDILLKKVKFTQYLVCKSDILLNVKETLRGCQGKDISKKELELI